MLKKCRNLLNLHHWLLFSAIAFYTFFKPKLITAQETLHRVIITGNFADVDTGSLLIEHLGDLINEESGPTSVILAGDMVRYPDRKSIHPEDSTRLVSLFEHTASSQCKLYLIPGDRDWNKSQKYGWQCVLALEKFVARQAYDHVTWAISNGCPGPVEVDLDDQLRLIAVQTQWWNHPYERPEPADALCRYTTEEDFLEELDDAIKDSENRNVLMVGHYPVISHGESGGRISPKTHLFPFSRLNPDLYIPLPVLGSLYAAFRQNVGSPEDITNKRYSDIVKEFEDVTFSNPSMVYVSGHEANMQLIRHGNSYLMNSGSIGKKEFVGKGKKTIYKKSTRGISELRYLTNGEVVSRFLKYDPREGFTRLKENFLYQSPCGVPDPNTLVPRNTVLGFCGGDPFSEIDGSYLFDSVVTVSAGPEYQANGLKKTFFGKHYRKDWTAEVEVPYLNLDTIGGGLELSKVGGGSETLSLKFISSDNKEYAFRSVNKDPISKVKYDLRETVIGVIVRDQISSQQPFGALTLPPLMDALNILHVKPKLYLLPPDSKLGYFSGIYGNMMGLFEENPKVSSKKGYTWESADKILKTYRFLGELYQSHNTLVDKEAYAKARMFDILIGDPGRGEDNWKWAGYTYGKQTIYQPIPRDRDEVFYLRDGFFPWLVDRRFVKFEGENFGKHIHDLKSLTYTGRYMDRIISSQLSKEDWTEVSREIKLALTDSLIESSIKRLPKASFQHSGQEIIRNLKHRRDHLELYAEKLHHILSKKVDILGSNEEEYFEIIRREDGGVEVFMYDRIPGYPPRKGKNLYYYRRFENSETKEIRIFGLAGGDVFMLKGKSFKSITIRIIGGPGDDIIRDSSRVVSLFHKTRIYENGDHAEIFKGKEGLRVNNIYRDSYNFQPTSFVYNRTYPLPYVAYNRDDGIVYSFGMMFLRQGYGKKPFRSRHTMRGAIANNSSYTLRYHGRWRQVVKNWDLDFLTEVANPSRFFYFFGLGNETVKNDSLFRADYYGSRYNYVHFTLGMSRSFWKNSEFFMGARLENNQPQIKANSILFEVDNDSLFGRDRANIIHMTTYLDLDLRDDTQFPTQGMRLFLQHEQGWVTNRDYTQSRKTWGSIEYHVPFRTPLPLFLSLRAAGGTSKGDIPYYNLFRLGHGSNLRGYFRNRFTGHHMVSANSELRLQLFNLKAVSIPIRIGIKGFYDVGKVYVDGETSDKLHMGYGGGLYVIPYLKKITLNTTLGFSEEESLFIKFSVGVPFQ